MQEFEKYIEKLFSDPGFAMFLAVVSLWYSFYLYRLPQKPKTLLIMTMSNWQKHSPRETTFVIINNSNKDLIKTDLLNGNPIKIIFKENLTISHFIIKYDSFKNGNFKLNQNTQNEYQIEFDIFKMNQAIVLVASHDSKKHMDETYTDIEVEGILINVEIERDDFSDQMVRRAHSVEIEAVIGTAILSVFISFAIRAFLKPLDFVIPFTYIFTGSFFVCLIPVFNYFAGRVGHNDYKLFWKFLKISRKNK